MNFPLPFLCCNALQNIFYRKWGISVNRSSLLLLPPLQFVIRFWINTLFSRSVYSGHQSILLAPAELESNPHLWLQIVHQVKVRDVFLSYSVLELCMKGVGSQVMQLRVSLAMTWWLWIFSIGCYFSNRRYFPLHQIKVCSESFNKSRSAFNNVCIWL